MMLSRIISYTTGVILCFSFSFSSLADEAVEFGDYVIHYNALATDILLPEVARAYKIKRSKNRGMVNIVVQKKKAEGTEGIKAKVSGTASNLNAQLKHLNFKEIQDANVTYYIADFRVTNKEIINFKVDVTPAGSTKSHTLKFQKEFYTN